MVLRGLKEDALAVLLGIPIGLASLGIVSGFNPLSNIISYSTFRGAAPEIYRNDQTYFYFYREEGSLILHVADLQGIKEIGIFGADGKVRYKEVYGENEVLPTLLDRLMPSGVAGLVHLELMDGENNPTFIINFQIPSLYDRLQPETQQI